MNRETAAALGRINRDFYDRYGAAFDQTRRQPWPGWERVLATAAAALAVRRPEVLDVGCGNARLALFLAERLGRDFGYVGVDSSAVLLRAAEARAGGPRRRFERLDLVADGGTGLPPGPFDLVAALGLLHHVPGAERRRRLVEDLAGRVAAGGFLALAFWQFGDRERFRQKVVPWERYNRRAAESIDVGDLEEGDVLLAWGERPAAAAIAGDPPPVRYCHWAPPAEADALGRATGLELADRFVDDGAGGDLNLYLVLERRGL